MLDDIVVQFGEVLVLGVAAAVEQVVSLAALDVGQPGVNLRDAAIVEVVPRLGEGVHRVGSVVPEARATEVIRNRVAVVDQVGGLLLSLGQHVGRHVKAFKREADLRLELLTAKTAHAVLALA